VRVGLDTLDRGQHRKHSHADLAADRTKVRAARRVRSRGVRSAPRAQSAVGDLKPMQSVRGWHDGQEFPEPSVCSTGLVSRIV